jgi:pimeloyl-ACP methyl ester carboxylesterase
MNQVKIQNISARGLSFKSRTCGLENKGDMVIFIHGFPESSIIWEKAMVALADRGFRCIAYDQRGYSLDSIPEGVENYTAYNLSTDVVAIADAFGNTGKFHLVGHDWGASIGWSTLGFYPERIQSWTAMATPHPKAFNYALDKDPVQKEKSKYIMEFAKPDLPEASLAADDYSRLRKLWDGFPQEFIDDFLRIFSVPEARTGAVNYYRGLFMPPSEKNPASPIDEVKIPTLYLWGLRDLALGKTGANETAKYMMGEYKFVQMDATHWMMEFNSKECIKEIVDHIEKFSAKK